MLDPRRTRLVTTCIAGVALASMAVFAGCSPLPIVPLAPEHRGLSVFVADPPISWSGDSALHCSSASSVKSTMTDALLKAGYRVITTPDADITVELRLPR